MTGRHRIRAEQLRIGAPLPVDIYDGNNRLLLRRGHVLTSEHQLERLIEEGLFTDAPLPRAQDGASDEAAGTQDETADARVADVSKRTAARATQRVSIYAEVTDAAKTLEAIFCAPESNPTFGDDVRQVAQGVLRACQLDPDAALAHVMFARGLRYPIRQAVNVAILTALLLERKKVDPARVMTATCAALTMNLSMQALQDHLYREKQPTETQRKEIHSHPLRSAELLAALRIEDPLWRAMVEQHHELVDGTGYPNKLQGNAVLPEARVIGLADRYCAAVTERAYRSAVAPDVALNLLRTNSGTAIETTLVDDLVHWIGVYPPGTVVGLVNREVCVVTRRLRDPRHPVVYAVAAQSLQPFESPRKRLTASQPQYHIEKVYPREVITFPVVPEVLWPRTVTDDEQRAADA